MKNASSVCENLTQLMSNHRFLACHQTAQTQYEGDPVIMSNWWSSPLTSIDLAAHIICSSEIPQYMETLHSSMRRNSINAFTIYSED